MDIESIKERLREDANLSESRSYGALAKLSRDALAAIEYLEALGPDGDAASRGLKSQASTLTPLPAQIEALRILEALRIAEEAISEALAGRWSEDPELTAVWREAAAVLAKLRPFVEAALGSVDELHALIGAAQQGNHEKRAGLDLYLDGAMGHIVALRELRSALVGAPAPTEGRQP